MEFSEFTPDSFEQFIRALALKIIGPGVTIFGNGPDGGREASFRGEVPYPFPPASQWNGYGVIQAKFKEKLEGTKIDNAWAKRQLEDELAKWMTSEKRKPKPDYYIFCTNVELTSASGGGKDVLENLLEKYKNSSNLKAFSIWDGVQLISFINTSSEIRSRYSCFFTTGDLLHRLAKSLPHVPDPDVILTSYLCKEISADEDAKLSQAGDRSEDRIRLANVFVDLPSSTQPVAEPLREDDIGPASIYNLLKVSACKLDPLSLYEQRALEEDSPCTFFGRFLFLGGPGSGKSTIGQFLAQIHRAALLDRRPKHRIESRVLDIIRGIKNNCSSSGLPWPKVPRFPFRVDLNAFAKALTHTRDKINSLSEYLRKNISRDFKFTHEDLREWLRIYPSLLILDGLDEVPVSSNRRDVIEEIQIFLHEMRDIEADLMIVASSRPEGYGGEFEGEEIACRYLTPLSGERAMALAKKYISAKIGSLGEQRGEDALEILKTAVENPLIARLMRSPLQVTFMVTVVAASGKPSESRWQLFNDYYRIIYERELHKAVPPFNQVLNSRRQDIDALHHKVGFILQCRAEFSGNTQADLAEKEFDDMVTQLLEEAGLPPENLQRNKEMILGAASSRLVFLTSKTPGRLSFDVRSLQEYMAAACMTGADVATILSTLEMVAHSTYWRNTLLFAIGRFFSESQLRNHHDKIRVFCEDLNLRDASYSEAKIGSYLALDILESGAVGHVPKVSRSLANCALGLLCIDDEDDEAVQVLVDIYDSSLSLQYIESLKIWLGQTDTHRSITAWLLVLGLEKKGIEWAKDLVVQHWPADQKLVWNILARWLPLGTEYIYAREGNEGYNLLSERDTERLRNVIPHLTISQFLNWIFSMNISSEKDANGDWLQKLIDWGTDEQSEELNVELTVVDHRTGFEMSIMPLPRPLEIELFAMLASAFKSFSKGNQWGALAVLSDFYVSPSANSLAAVLLELSERELFTDNDLLVRLCWPLQYCLRAARSKEHLAELAQAIRNGCMGDFGDWVRTEENWMQTGISSVDLSSALFENGPPLCAIVSSGHLRNVAAVEATFLTESLCQVLEGERQIRVKRFFAWVISIVLNRTDTLLDQDPIFLINNLLTLEIAWNIHTFAPTPRFNACISEDWYKFFDVLGKNNKINFFPYYWHEREAAVAFLIRAYDLDRSKTGILRLLGLYCASGLTMEWRLPLSCVEEGNFLDWILIRLADKNLTADETETIAKMVATMFAAPVEAGSVNLLITALEYHAPRLSSSEEILSAVCGTLSKSDWFNFSRIASIRRRLIRTRPSGFDEVSLQELGLPSIAEIV